MPWDEVGLRQVGGWEHRGVVGPVGVAGFGVGVTPPRVPHLAPARAVRALGRAFFAARVVGQAPLPGTVCVVVPEVGYGMA